MVQWHGQLPELSLYSRGMNNSRFGMKSGAIFLVSMVLAGIVPPPAGATEYFVAVDGSDANAGTRAQPWKTIQYGLNQLVAGDTLSVRAGNYPENLTLNQSGTEDQSITLKAHADEKVTLNPGSVSARDRSYWRIEGLRILNTRGDRPAIEFSGAGRSVEITGNEITGLVSRNAAALRVGGTMRDFTISENHVHHNRTGVQEAIRVHERTRNFQILNNEVNDNSNIGIDIVGWAQYGKPIDGVVRGNFVHNNSSDPGWGSGIYLDGPERILVEHNICTGQEFGIQIAVEPSDDSCSHNIVRYNIAYENREYGLGIGGYTGGTVHHCQVYNNVLVNNRREIGFSKNAGHDNLVVNNILYNPTGQSINYLSRPIDTVIDYNCYFTRFGETPGGNSIVADPRFVNLEKRQFALRPESPCIDAGTVVAESVRDFPGKTVPGKDAAASRDNRRPDIGAVEFLRSITDR